METPKNANMVVEGGSRPGALRDQMRQHLRDRIRVRTTKLRSARAPQGAEHRQDPIAVAIYARLAGLRFDHAQPFISWAKAEGLGPATFAEWSTRYRTYLDRPIVG